MAKEKQKKKYNIDAGVEEVENGCIVRVSCNDHDGDYRSRKFVATSKPEANAILKDALDGKIKPKKVSGPSAPSANPKLGSSKKKSKRGRVKAQPAKSY